MHPHTETPRCCRLNGSNGGFLYADAPWVHPYSLLICNTRPTKRVSLKVKAQTLVGNICCGEDGTGFGQMARFIVVGFGKMA